MDPDPDPVFYWYPNKYHKKYMENNEENMHVDIRA